MPKETKTSKNLTHEHPVSKDKRCYCPDDCNCHYPWRTNYCGCKQH